jgi:hypothetical protein
MPSMFGLYFKCGGSTYRECLCLDECECAFPSVPVSGLLLTRMSVTVPYLVYPPKKKDIELECDQECDRLRLHRVTQPAFQDDRPGHNHHWHDSIASASEDKPIITIVHATRN